MNVKKTIINVLNNRNKRDDKIEEIGSGTTNFSKIFIVSFMLIILIIFFTCYYRYVHARIIHAYERCTKRRKDTFKEDMASVRLQESDSFAKRSFSRICSNKPKVFPWNTADECSLNVILQDEKKKLLASQTSRKDTGHNSSKTNLSQILSLKMYFPMSSKNFKFSSDTKINQRRRRTSEILDQQKSYKGICCSETDLKFLTVPVSARKSDKVDQDEGGILNYWNPCEPDDYYNCGNGTDSKLLELKLDNRNSSNDYSQNHVIVTSKSNCPLYSSTSKTWTIGRKCLSDSNQTACKLEILPDISLKMKRSYGSESYINSITWNVLAENSFLHEQEERKKMIPPDKSNMEVNIPNRTIQLPASEKFDNSEINVFRNDVQDVISEKHFATEKHSASISGGTFKGNNNLDTSFIHDFEPSETYDELGMLFSYYMKLQMRPCQRKYCSLLRHLRNKRQHNERKCRAKLNYYRTRSYDQRPACNSGNVCEDTYDEFDLTRASTSERRIIYHRMFKRRKEFLNQPYVSSK